MAKHIKTCVAGILLMVSSSVYAKGSFEDYGYIGLGYSYVDADIGGITSVDNSLLGLVGGYRFHENFAVEARGYGNISNDSILGVDLQIDHSFSLFGKAVLPVWKYLDIYGLLGFGQIKASVTGQGYNTSDSDSDFQYGIGAAFNKGNPLELQLEWVKWYDNDGLDVNGLNLNLVWNL